MGYISSLLPMSDFHGTRSQVQTRGFYCKILRMCWLQISSMHWLWKNFFRIKWNYFCWDLQHLEFRTLCLGKHQGTLSFMVYEMKQSMLSRLNQVASTCRFLCRGEWCGCAGVLCNYLKCQVFWSGGQSIRCPGLWVSGNGSWCCSSIGSISGPDCRPLTLGYRTVSFFNYIRVNRCFGPGAFGCEFNPWIIQAAEEGIPYHGDSNHQFALSWENWMFTTPSIPPANVGHIQGKPSDAPAKKPRKGGTGVKNTFSDV